MMAETNINIRMVSGEEAQDTPQQEAQNLGKPNPQNPIKPMGALKYAAAGAAFMGAVKQAGQGVVSRIGKWTGNSTLQNQINFAQTVIGEASTIGLGFAAAGPAGAIVAAVPIAINKAFTIADYYFDMKWERKQAEREFERMGTGAFRNK